MIITSKLYAEQREALANQVSAKIEANLEAIRIRAAQLVEPKDESPTQLNWSHLADLSAVNRQLVEILATMP